MPNIFKQFIKPSEHRGFTLAEVLITLGIIGVVAAMTLPSVINSYEKKETISKIKKVYSVLSQTSLFAIPEYGDPEGWEMPTGSSVATGKFFAEKYLIPYLNVARVCESNDNPDCNYTIYKLNGSPFTDYIYTRTYRFYLNDGTFLMVHTGGDSQHPKLVVILFDINGKRGQNKLGRDIFILQYLLQTNLPQSKEYQGKFIPAWGDYDSRNELLGTGNNQYCNKTKEGRACLAVIFMDGWEIKSDYPW